MGGCLFRTTEPPIARPLESLGSVLFAVLATFGFVLDGLAVLAWFWCERELFDITERVSMARVPRMAIRFDMSMISGVPLSHGGGGLFAKSSM